MKKELTMDFQTRLWDAVSKIEQNSQAEVVVIIRANSGKYLFIPLLWGIIAAWITHTYLMFAPDYFENWLVYYLPLLAFLVSFGIAHHPVVIRLCSKQAVRQKNVEILARALFQKGGIHHTRAKTGMLIFCSNLEKICYLLPDRGVEMAIPADEWQILRQDFQGIYADKNPYAALITQLNSSTAVFSRYLPAQENDINELPDALDIQL